MDNEAAFGLAARLAASQDERGHHDSCQSKRVFQVAPTGQIRCQHSGEGHSPQSGHVIQTENDPHRAHGCPSAVNIGRTLRDMMREVAAM
jgi:hypothetical protein